MTSIEQPGEFLEQLGSHDSAALGIDEYEERLLERHVAAAQSGRRSYDEHPARRSDRRLTRLVARFVTSRLLAAAGGRHVGTHVGRGHRGYHVLPFRASRGVTSTHQTRSQ